MEDFSSIVFHKQGPAYKQHTCKSSKLSIICNNNSDGKLQQHSLPHARTCLQAAYLSINKSIHQSVIIIIMKEEFISILFHKHGPAYKQHTYQSINQSVVIIIVMEDFSSILYQKHGPAYKQHTCQSINQSVVIIIVMEDFSRILFHKHGPAYKQHTYQSINQ